MRHEPADLDVDLDGKIVEFRGRAAHRGAVEAVEGMRLRGNIAKQIDGLPEGTQVDFRFTD